MSGIECLVMTMYIAVIEQVRERLRENFVKTLNSAHKFDCMTVGKNDYVILPSVL